VKSALWKSQVQKLLLVPFWFSLPDMDAAKLWMIKERQTAAEGYDSQTFPAAAPALHGLCI
jgi:hypothetical protein